jgi:mannose-6-phosphate isomerase-like protein (cupin superfamily)
MKRTMPFVIVALALVVSACAERTSNRVLALRYESGWKMSALDAEIARAGSRDVAVSELGRTAWVSEHIAVVRTEEKPHYHRFHDSTVVVLRGEGLMTVDQKQIPMKTGDVAHIHRGVPHFFRNTSSSPAAALVIFSPPFDGRDFVAEEEKKKAEDDEDRPRKKRSWWWPFR